MKHIKPFAIASVLLMAACSDNASTSSSAAAPAASNPPATEAAKPVGQNYIVMSQPSYPPFASRGENGQIIGLDMDLLNAIAEKEGFNLTFLPHDMSGLLETLDLGQADIVATGVNITPERQEKYDFSQPYLEASWVALLHKDKVKVNSWADLQNKPIAAQEASLSTTQLKQTKITQQIIPVKTVYLGVKAVESGEAAAVYDVDSVLNTHLKADAPFYTVTDTQSGKVPFGFVLKKGNTELKTKLDNGLNAIRADGTYQKILDKWYPK